MQPLYYIFHFEIDKSRQDKSAGSCTDLEKARAVRTTNAKHRADDLAPTIQELQSSGCTSLRSIAAGLNQTGDYGPE
jgi:hypothetical protein